MSDLTNDVQQNSIFFRQIDDTIMTANLEEIELPIPSPPYAPGRSLRQSVVPTMGGRVITVTHSSDAIVSPVLTWDFLETTEYDELADFIERIAEGSANTFTFRDWASPREEHVVRYLSGIDQASRTEQDGWSVSLRLLIEG